MTIFLAALLTAFSIALVTDERPWVNYRRIDVKMIALSPDQKLLAAGTNWGVFLIDLKSGKIKKEIALERKYRISSISFSPSGRYLCASSAWAGLGPPDGTAGELLLYDLFKNQRMFRYASKADIGKAVFFPAEDGLAAITENEVMKFDLTGKIDTQTNIHIQPTQYLRYLYVAGQPPMIYFQYDNPVTRKHSVTQWEPKKNQLRQWTDSKTILAVDPTLNRIIYLGDQYVQISSWRPAKKEKPVQVSLKWSNHTLPRPWSIAPPAAFSRDGKHLYVAMSDEDPNYPTKIVDWDLSADKEIVRFRRSDNGFISAFLVSNQWLVLATEDPRIEVWNRQTRRLEKIIDLDPQY